MRRDPTEERKMTKTLKMMRIPRVSRSEKSETNNHQIINSKVGVIFANTKGGFGERLRLGEGRAIS
ncbi:hypothetical protein ES332_D09G195600v1 [Gossypium tomentosum]|uniref:Uncharacterized protein n=1 Tax=Gossypium tomentosum TaxID=34277 RepID=A0A5D2JIT1_GOSTO|nr:hypothetical protein ES332_D09G195600v1 [Gossypium tomentosum]